MFYLSSFFVLVLVLELVLELVLVRHNRRKLGWIGWTPELEIFIFHGVKGQFEYEYEYRFTEYEYESSFKRFVGYISAGSMSHV
jgi:hypothetical protein